MPGTKVEGKITTQNCREDNGCAHVTIHILLKSAIWITSTVGRPIKGETVFFSVK